MKLCSLQTSKQYTMPNFECMHFLLCTLFSQSELKKDQQRGIQKVLQKLLILFLVFVCVSCRKNLQYTTKTTKSCNLFEVQQQNHKLSIVNLFVCVSLSLRTILQSILMHRLHILSSFPSVKSKILSHPRPVLTLRTNNEHLYIFIYIYKYICDAKTCL